MSNSIDFGDYTQLELRIMPGYTFKGDLDTGIYVAYDSVPINISCGCSEELKEQQFLRAIEWHECLAKINEKRAKKRVADLRSQAPFVRGGRIKYQKPNSL